MDSKGLAGGAEVKVLGPTWAITWSESRLAAWKKMSHPRGMWRRDYGMAIPPGGGGVWFLIFSLCGVHMPYGKTKKKQAKQKALILESNKTVVAGKTGNTHLITQQNQF